MPRVDLTARMARQSKPQAKDTILFDKTLPGFGLAASARCGRNSSPGRRSSSPPSVPGGTSSPVPAFQDQSSFSRPPSFRY